MQLGALGFIGLCGVLHESGANPRWLQIVSAVLVLASLALACAAIALVASTAWPLPGAAPADLRAGARRVRRGIALTFVALACLALGTSTSWWPSAGGVTGTVEVTTRAGVLCGELRTGDRGAVSLDVGGRRVSIALADVVSLRATGHCPT